MTPMSGLISTMPRSYFSRTRVAVSLDDFDADMRATPSMLYIGVIARRLR